MGSALALEHKLAEARQEVDVERRLTLQLREDVAAAEVSHKPCLGDARAAGLGAVVLG